jgi:hypothetical protein
LALWHGVRLHCTDADLNLARKNHGFHSQPLRTVLTRSLGVRRTWLARSADDEELARYHVEAGIAWEHCRAPSFADTGGERATE